MSYILEALRRSEQERHQEQIKSLTGQDSFIHVNKKSAAIWPYLLILALVFNGAILTWVLMDKTEATNAQDFDLSRSVDESADADPLELNAETIVVNDSQESLGSTSVKGVSQGHQEHTSHGESDAGTLEKALPVQEQKSSTVETSELPEDIYVDGGVLIQPKNQQQRTFPLPPVETAVGYNHSHQHVRTVDKRYESVPYLVEMDLSFQKSIPKLTFNSHIYSDMASARRVMINNVYLREGQVFSGVEVINIGDEDIVFRKNGTQFKRPVMRDW